MFHAARSTRCEPPLCVGIRTERTMLNGGREMVAYPGASSLHQSYRRSELQSFRGFTFWLCSLVGLSLGSSAACVAADKGGVAGGTTLSTTPADFVQPGTPAGGIGLPTPIADFIPAGSCAACHSNYGSQDPFLVNEITMPW